MGSRRPSVLAFYMVQIKGSLTFCLQDKGDQTHARKEGSFDKVDETVEAVRQNSICHKMLVRLEGCKGKTCSFSMRQYW